MSLATLTNEKKLELLIKKEDMAWSWLSRRFDLEAEQDEDVDELLTLEEHSYDIIESCQRIRARIECDVRW